MVWTCSENGRGEITKRSYEMEPTRKKTQGRHKLTRAVGIRGLMGEKRLMEEDWNDRGNCRTKIISLSNGRRKMWKRCKAC